MIKYYADRETAENAARQCGGKADKCILLHEDGTPILDAGEPVEV